MLLKFLRRQPWDIRNVTRPWGHRFSIYQHVVERLKFANTSLSRSDAQLPDEDVVAGKAGFRWVAGAFDGAVSPGAEGDDAEAITAQILLALRSLADRATDEHAARLYSLIAQHRTLLFVDALLERVVNEKTLRTDRVQAIARWLATESPDREAVKTAIAILGVVSHGEDRELLLTLGKHEEFTLFSAVALQHTEQGPEPLVWELAQHVTGWGRIHTVERLAATRDERIKAWLLREGCRNDIMDEYTALICAKTGDLVTALRAPNPDQALMNGAGAILAALIRGGPAEGIEGYADGPEAVELYLAHLRGGDADLEDLNVVATIERFVAEERQKADDSAASWRERAAAIDEHVRAFKARPEWPAKIQSGLSSSDRSLFSNAAEAAKLFGTDTWDIYFQRAERGEDQWYFVMQTDDPIRIERVVSLAEERLPLKEIASGPSDELGLGPEFQAHSALDFVLQDLCRFPGKGWALIRTGLQSPVTRNRHMAVRALAAWDRTIWPAETELLLRQALKAELDEGVRESMRKVLESQPLQL
jgi:hypothetical protein